MDIMIKGTDCRVTREPRCDHCEDPTSYCIECRKSLTKYIDEEIVCYGPKGETWHSCKECDEKLKKLVCPKCKSHRLNRWGVDEKDRTASIVYNCKECDNKWKEKHPSSK